MFEKRNTGKKIGPTLKVILSLEVGDFINSITVPLLSLEWCFYKTD